MDRTDLIMAVYMYINDPAIKAENLSDEQLKQIYKDVYGVEDCGLEVI